MCADTIHIYTQQRQRKNQNQKNKIKQNKTVKKKHIIRTKDLYACTDKGLGSCHAYNLRSSAKNANAHRHIHTIHTERTRSNDRTTDRLYFRHSDRRRNNKEIKTIIMSGRGACLSHLQIHILYRSCLLGGTVAEQSRAIIHANGIV